MNIDDAKKSRATLKSYFVRNAIPTEQQFAQVMDSMLNQRDDGLVKVAGDPLSIEAAGDDTSFKKALNLYNNLADADPAWTVSLRPRANPADPTSGRPGLSVNDAAGNSRLAVDAATGRVGIGTVAPAEALDVNGRVKAGSVGIGPWPANPNFYAYFGTTNINQAAAVNYALLQGTTGGDTGRTFLNSPLDIRFRINNGDQMVLANNGFVGIGTSAPSQRLDVIGPYIRVSGAGNESVYMGGDGAGNDAQFGSLNPTVTNAAMYNPGRAAYMNLFCAAVNPSDARLKEDVEEIPTAIEQVTQLRPVSFHWTADADDPARTRHLGLIAQEVQKILPDAVLESGRGHLSINFTAIVSLLVKAVQEQQAKLKELEQALTEAVGPKKAEA
jgi:hypothetical protein